MSVCYQEYFNSLRRHQGITSKVPTEVIDLKNPRTFRPEFRDCKTPEVGGLIISFKLVA